MIPNDPGDPAGTSIVGGGSHVPGTKAIMERLEVVERCPSGPNRVSPLIHIGIDTEAEGLGRGSHELPHPNGRDPRSGPGRVSGLNGGQIHQFLRHSSPPKALTNHPGVKTLPLQIPREHGPLIGKIPLHPALHFGIHFYRETKRRGDFGNMRDRTGRDSPRLPDQEGKCNQKYADAQKDQATMKGHEPEGLLA